MRAYRHVAVVSQAQRGKRALMIKPAFGLLCALALAACSLEPRQRADQLLMPGYLLPGTPENRAYNRKRGAVEFFVKDNHPRIMADIANGDGPYLNEAIALSGVSPRAREALKMELRGDQQIYQSSPSALVTTLLGYQA